ncbi:MAG: hypothetical protein AAF340_16630 [Pseudomonadota bacterium]
MNMPEDNIGSSGRLRRPKPERTEPRRNILGAFLQNGERRPQTAAPTQSGLENHPLGLQPDAETGQPPRIASSQNQEDIQAASDVIDRHIRDGKQYEIPVEDGMWSRLSSLTGGLDNADLADLAKLLTRSYSELASVWVEIAGKLRETINSSPSGSTGAPSSSSVFAAPALFIQSPLKLTAKVQMFADGSAAKMQPLMPETGKGEGLSEVSFADDQISIFVPEGTATGRYHGLILSETGTPIGTVSVTAPEQADP